MPRNLVDPWRHVEDYIAALDYVRGPSWPTLSTALNGAPPLRGVTS
ncbi:unnamed protein product [Ectocarpus fasciculatus]